MKIINPIYKNQCQSSKTGIRLGLSAAGIGSGFLGVPFIVGPGIGVTAFLFSAAVGMVFGYFPARKAARLSGKNP